MVIEKFIAKNNFQCKQDSQKECNSVVTPHRKRKLHVSKPTVPKVYCMSKMHIPGMTVRSTVSAIVTPIYSLAKWRKFNNLRIVEDNFSTMYTYFQKIINNEVTEVFET